MSALTVQFELPADVLGALDVPRGQLSQRLKELISLELFREGRISSGKAAELLGITKEGFVQILARHGVPYFSESAEELAQAVAVAERTLGEQ